jgi:hypothetical protein
MVHGGQPEQRPGAGTGGEGRRTLRDAQRDDRGGEVQPQREEAATICRTLSGKRS